MGLSVVWYLVGPWVEFFLDGVSVHEGLKIHQIDHFEGITPEQLVQDLLTVFIQKLKLCYSKVRWCKALCSSMDLKALRNTGSKNTSYFSQ